MKLLHGLLIFASAAELYLSSGTYVISFLECAMCLGQFALASLGPVEP
jgi:hypothetical protein